ncbi:Flp family type IVb pilin [Azoarcus sp. DN11]|uniref:Flp family type IVb pilin n=1 Tax=Azoarcus sp. DN11 TaxID=356837 RepID=UPI000EB3E363|nr:Flp family type IVb pilin [Azoarcus sp. DN11]AYH45628.1 Flp family type IVb pilin [Azoarcus sp. DN11]
MKATQCGRAIKVFLTEQDGVTAIEYALLGALIFFVIVAAVTLAGTDLSTLFATVAGLIP